MSFAVLRRRLILHCRLRKLFASNCSNSAVAHIVQRLASGSLCPRCCLRYLDTRSSTLYLHAEKDLFYALAALRISVAEAASLVYAQHVICSVCMGTLQQPFTTALAKVLVDPLQPEPNSGVNVTAEIEPLIVDSLSDLDKSNGVRKPVEVKEVARGIISHAIQTRWMYAFDQQSDLLVIAKLYPIRDAAMARESARGSRRQRRGKWGQNNKRQKIANSSSWNVQDASAHVSKEAPVAAIDDEGDEAEADEEVGEDATKDDSADQPALAATATSINLPESGMGAAAPLVTFFSKVSIAWSRRSIYVGGRYLKLYRNISQSRWTVRRPGGNAEAGSENPGQSKQGGSQLVRLTALSVAELISKPITEAFQCKETRFSSAGREDADVLMLNTGRPFALELVDCRLSKHLVQRDPDLMKKLEAAIEADANGMVKTLHLQIVSKSAVEVLRTGEETKKKQYSMLVCIEKAAVTDEELARIHAVKDLEVSQTTPVRVMHRRSMQDRPKIIHAMRAELVPGGMSGAVHMKLWMQTSAGTYVKEFVHGDRGRTTPSLGQIMFGEREGWLHHLDLRYLNVEAVELEFPPSTGNP